MDKSRLLGAVCACMCTFGLSATAHASLIGVLPITSGGTDYQAYYDTDLDITWAANANINGTNTWANQGAWAGGLTIGGVSGWRLPSADVNGDNTIIDCNGGGVTGCADNEMGYLFWEEGITAATPGPFTNVQSTQSWYWSSTSFSGFTAWTVRFDNGTLDFGQNKNNSRFAWAVLDGGSELIATPIPAAFWLFGSGLIGLVSMARRKKA